ncbi:retrovirus-related pol polyprotein from transposon TNT 1-94 [Tanacetum coccineum]
MTFANEALNGIEEDDGGIEIGARTLDLGQDGLGVFYWSEEADNAPVALALMATSSTDSTNSEMEYDLKIRDWKLGEKQKEFENVIKERDELKEKLKKWSNATILQTEILNKQKVLSDKTCIGFGVEYSSSEESNNSSGDETLIVPYCNENLPKRKGIQSSTLHPLVKWNRINNTVESKNRDDLIKNKEQTQNTVKSNTDRNKVIIEDWVDSDDEEVPLGFSEIKKQTVLKSETSSENKSPRSKDSFGQRSRRRGLGYRNGKVCFVCYSPDHLIKDCDLHERKLKQTQKPKPLETQGSRDSRSVWNNTRRVNHRNFTSDYRHPHQRRSFIPSAVLTREGLKSTVRSKMSQAVPSQSTASTFYQKTARPNASKAVLSQSTARPYFPRPVFSTSTGRPYYPRMDNVRPRASSSSPPIGFFNTRTIDKPKSPKTIIKSKWVKKESTAGTQAVTSPTTKGEKGVLDNPTQTWRSKGAYLDHRHKNNGSYTLKKFEYVTPLGEFKSALPRIMTGDKDKLSDFKEYKGGYVAFGNDPKGGRITGKGTIKTSCIDFENVSYVKELKFNLLHVSQICDKKHNHRRLGHVNFKNINKLVKSNLLRGLPQAFKHDHTVWLVESRKFKQKSTLSAKQKVKTIRCDHGTEFKNMLMNEFCAKKGIQREYSIARTPQQNGVAERKNRTLIEAARTMLADSLLNNQSILFMKPFGCPLTILNTMDHLSKFEEKSEEGYFLGYSTNSKDQMNQKGKGPDWMFDLDILSPSLNYIPVRKENQVDTAVKQSNSVDLEDVDDQQFIVHGSSSIGNKAVSESITNDVQNKDSDESTVVKEVPLTTEDQDLQKEFENLMLQEIIDHSHMENQGLASEKRKEKDKEINDLSESDDDLPKDGIFHGNSFDDENKETEEKIDLKSNNMDIT